MQDLKNFTTVITLTIDICVLLALTMCLLLTSDVFTFIESLRAAVPGYFSGEAVCGRLARYKSAFM